MVLAKLTSKGQITIPVEIRKKLKLKEGSKVFFIEEKGRIIFQNASQVALREFQTDLAREAAAAGFQTEEDVVQYMKNRWSPPRMARPTMFMHRLRITTTLSS